MDGCEGGKGPEQEVDVGEIVDAAGAGSGGQGVPPVCFCRRCLRRRFFWSGPEKDRGPRGGEGDFEAFDAVAGVSAFAFAVAVNDVSLEQAAQRESHEVSIDGRVSGTFMAGFSRHRRGRRKDDDADFLQAVEAKGVVSAELAEARVFDRVLVLQRLTAGVEEFHATVAEPLVDVDDEGAFFVEYLGNFGADGFVQGHEVGDAVAAGQAVGTVWNAFEEAAVDIVTQGKKGLGTSGQ